MNARVKLFIESNIELIDNENWGLFFSLADDYFFNNRIIDLVECLKEAGIDTTKAREELLLLHMNECFSKFALHQKFGAGSVIDMITLVDVALDSYYGFEKPIIGEYVLKWLNCFPTLEYKHKPELFVIKE